MFSTSTDMEVVLNVDLHTCVFFRLVHQRKWIYLTENGIFLNEFSSQYWEMRYLFLLTFWPHFLFQCQETNVGQSQVVWEDPAARIKEKKRQNLHKMSTFFIIKVFPLREISANTNHDVFVTQIHFRIAFFYKNIVHLFFHRQMFPETHLLRNVN